MLSQAYKSQLSLLKEPIVTTLGSMFIHDRSGYAVMPLPNGRVLFMGGNDPSAEGKSGPLYSAELYDPTTGLFTATGDLAPKDVQRGGVTPPPNGKVLVSGGAKFFDPALGRFSAMLYDPALGRFSAIDGFDSLARC